jgi:hypothetical protein
MLTMTATAALELNNGRVDVETEALVYDLMASRTDLARYLDAARRTDLPYLVVTAEAVRAWKLREPKLFARFSLWLAGHGKQLVEV